MSHFSGGGTAGITRHCFCVSSTCNVIPAHFPRVVRGYFKRTFAPCCIGRGGPIPWLTRSPNLTSLDLFLWGTLKVMPYETTVDSDSNLGATISVAAANVHGMPGTLEWVRQ
ncbi:hypothetical protein AVEN_126775-1 [Araneus ventricosus]|uniref:Uncharacterized protein n=1 Tax=Araneus ventricosus TaxID=182803 RepID=A0A4Y2T0M3_ARAVE|nr:hypothetical protein AVEN_126775-1 [Araneus ventricosus]